MGKHPAAWLFSGVNDRQKGHTDVYTGEATLGACFLFDVGRPKNILIRQDGNDKWNVEYAQVEMLDGGETHRCSFNAWFEHSATKTCHMWSDVVPSDASIVA